MPGQQMDFAIVGDQSETAAQHILGEILNLVQVPRQRDFGIDFYCSVRLKAGNSAQTTRDLFSLQVGSPAKTVEYGGVRNGMPRQYEIEWLKSLTVPLFYARVSSNRERVDVYSMAPVWRILFRSPGAFEIRCSLEEPSSELFTIQAEQPTPVEQKAAFGDGNVWRINLGPPILSVTSMELQKPHFAERAVQILRHWLKLDWTTIVRFQTRIALTDFAFCWCTNTLDVTIQTQSMYWSPVPGANAPELVEALQPALINLGVSLQWQDNNAAFSFIPVLDWIKQLGVLSQFGRGLLDQLREGRDSGVSPARVINQKR